MDEVIFLFLYHKLDQVTLAHYRLLQQLHPRHQIVPLGYRLTIPEVLPDTVDVGLDWDHGWPIFEVWPEIDKIYYRWVLRPNRPRAKRYILFEYDILARVSAETFFQSVWNDDVAAVSIKTVREDPGWLWWRHGTRTKLPQDQWLGLSPLSAQLWSDEALLKVAQERRFGNCYCELRMGTLAKAVGLHCAEIPNAHQTISWRPEDIHIGDELTWFHPVKQ